MRKHGVSVFGQARVSARWGGGGQARKVGKQRGIAGKLQKIPKNGEKLRRIAEFKIIARKCRPQHPPCVCVCVCACACVYVRAHACDAGGATTRHIGQA